MSDQSAQESRRVSKARERQQRRKARREGITQARPAERSPRNRRATPVDRDRSLPQINLGILRPILIVAASGAFMLALIAGVGLFKNDPPEPDPNALWIGTDWSYQQQTDETMTSLINRLDQNRIGSVYVRVSELNFDGTWTGIPEQENRFDEVQDSVIAFAGQIKRMAPDIQTYGAIFVQTVIGENNYRLDQESIQRIVADFSGRVVTTMGFDGVMLVIEPVWSGDEEYLDLIRRVRDTIGDDALLAVAVPPDWTPQVEGVPVTSLVAPNTVWEREYKQRVALRGVDQIVVQAYNSYLTDPDDYSRWIAYQVETYADAIGELDTFTRVTIGVPTYANFLPAHDERIENIPAAVQGVKQGLDAIGELEWVIDGVAIYAEWDTDTIEWEQFQSNWVRR